MKRFVMLTALSLLVASGCSKKEKKVDDGVESSKVGEPAPAVEPAPEMPAKPMEDKDTQAKDIVDAAIAAGKFTTLVSAIQAAGMADTLKGEGPFTLFAPTDDAFKKLPEGTVENLLNDPVKLAAILNNHVVAGKYMAKDVASMKQATMLSEMSLPIDTSAGVKIGDAVVETTDIVASNGVIHAIDTVLLPAEK